MKTLRILCLFLPLLASATFARALNLWAEPMWMGSNQILHSNRPEVNINSDGDTDTTLTKSFGNKSMWGFGGNLSWMPSSNIAIGPSAVFSWSNTREKDKGVAGDTVLSRELIVMIPLALTITIDPIPQYKIHPIAHLSLGYNSVFIRNRCEREKATVGISDIDGYYNGVFIKFGADVMVDLGKQFSLFAGPQMQISTVTRRSGGNIIERNFNMTGIRFGASLLL
ncbi:MAG: hypothetical protein FWE23_01075 [Chitinivibrionia bacterium]|nr:hypothetical protein [Chitinivibrionia bacterium]